MSEFSAPATNSQDTNLRDINSRNINSSDINSTVAQPGVAEAEEAQTGLEPELGGQWRDSPDRTGLEPELGGVVRQQGVYVDEITCIGCKHCAHVARNTFYIEPDYGRSRVIRQDGDSEELIQEAIDTCPVDCIHWVDYTELKKLEEERKYQVVPIAGFPIDRSLITSKMRQKKAQKRSAQH